MDISRKEGFSLAKFSLRIETIETIEDAGRIAI